MGKVIDVLGKWTVNEKWIENKSGRKGSLVYEVEVKLKGRKIEMVMQDEPTSPSPPLKLTLTEILFAKKKVFYIL